MQKMLATSINILKSKEFSSATLVLGNITCDLDSAVCAVVHSLFLHWRHSLSSQDADRKHVFVPILNVKRKDFELKTEVAYCFGELNVTKDHLLFRDDLDTEELASSTNTEVVLVDHHILADEDKCLHDRIVEIIDHRPRDDDNWTYGPGVQTDIKLVGSCCTLVCERIASCRDSEQFFKCYSPCARLLYSTIILDTFNFSQQAKKGTELDMKQVLYLEEILEVQDPTRHRAETLTRLVEARRDVSRLSPAQLLRKDVKVSGRILVPSFPVLVKEVLSRDGVAEALSEELTQRGCSIAVLLGMRLGDNMQRDLAVYSDLECDAAVRLAEALERCTEPALQLQQLPSQLSNCRYYTQLNLAASRKQVMPIVDRFHL